MGNSYSEVVGDDPWWPEDSKKRNKVMHNNDDISNFGQMSKEAENITQENVTKEKEYIEQSDKVHSESTFLFLNSVPNKEDSTNAEKLDLFKKNLAEVRRRRQDIIAEKSREMQDLREELDKQKKENKALRQMVEENGIVVDKQSESNEPDNSSVCDQMEKGHDFIDLFGSIERLHNECETEFDYNTKFVKLFNENSSLRQQIGFIVYKSLEDKKKVNEECLQSKEELKGKEELATKTKELRMEVAELHKQLQTLNSDILSFEKERDEYHVHITALKDVISCSKEMLQLRENELEELKRRIKDIEKSINERELQLMSSDLRNEYERQLRNIRNLRVLYEERARLSRIEHQNLTDQLTESQQRIEQENTKNVELQTKIEQLEKDISDRDDEISTINSTLRSVKTERTELQKEMSVINQLFSRILLGFNSNQDFDLDKLIKLLEENHDLLADIAVKEDSEETNLALPKLLFDLINQMNEKKQNTSTNEVSTEQTNDAEIQKENDDKIEVAEASISNNGVDIQDIQSNLPKVWRILTELLSHHQGTNEEMVELDQTNPCYKSVDTPAGPRLVLSVSKTYIRLKDLIVEKKSLQKEMSRLKHLNTHLEGKLQEQEKRLGEVSTELVKTWHMVGRMQRQHQQLHTHERILRYELSQKRKLLVELRAELGRSREQYDLAREKNNDSEHQCRKLRTEFALRRTQDMITNSAESGYSGEPSDEDDESGNAVLTVDNEHDENITCPELINNEIIVQEDQNNIDLILERAITPDDTSIEDNNSSDCNQNPEDEQTDKDENLERNSISPININNDENEKIESSTIITESPTETSGSEKPKKTSEEILAERDARFKRLEEQCKQLKKKYADQTEKGDIICIKLDSLHKQFSIDYTDTKPSCSTSQIDRIEEKEEPDDSVNENVSSENTESSSSDTTKQSNTEEILARRSARFERLEEQCLQLKRKYEKQTERGTEMCQKLDELHKPYEDTSDDTTVDKNESQNQTEETRTESNDNVPVSETPDLDLEDKEDNK